MIKRRQDILFSIIIVAAILLMILYSVFHHTLGVSSDNNNAITFNRSEQAYIKDNPTVYFTVSEELQYLNNGFLEEYLNRITRPAKIKIELVEQTRKDALGTIQIIDDKVRNNLDEINLSAPLFQIKGSLFIRKDLEGEVHPKLNGVVVKGQFSKADKEKLSYDKSSIDLIEVGSTEESVTEAADKELDCIIGDRTGIVYELREKKLMDIFEDTGEDLYKENVCLVTDKGDSTLYHIINQCIKGVDRQVLMSRTLEHWYGLSGSFVEEGRYSDAVILMIIIFAAVFTAFFFYYQSNKNLYNELTTRMNQLAASKQEMQTTFNGVSYYMAELDPKGMILDINKAFLEYVNQEPMGKHIGQFLNLSRDLEEKMRQMIEQIAITGRGVSEEFTFKRKIMEVNFFPIKNSKDNVDKLLFMASDVTSERMAERQLLQDNKMIAVGQLAAGVAHEIRNPLGLIRNYCYVLKNMEENEAKEQAIQIIERSVESSNKIIDNLLNFSRISKVSKEAIQIKNHIDSVLSLNKGMLKAKQISVSVDCSQDFIAYLIVESFDMILINLVSNAIDAMGEKGQLTITILHDEGEFSVEVADTGKGIETDIMDEIYNPFFTTKSNTEGNGLGLYIVYNEVKKMNGRIEMSSRIDKGTIFNVTLPIGMEEENG